MTNDAVWVCEKFASDQIYLHGTRWYLFGSALKGNGCSGDTDILVIYTIIDHALIIRKRIEQIELERPIHLIFMTEEEAQESDFVASERAILIYPITSEL